MLTKYITRTNVILGCSEPFQNAEKELDKHHLHFTLSKQTHAVQYKLHIVFNDCCLHITSAQEADRHYLFEAVIDDGFRTVGISRQQAQLVPVHFPQ